MPRLQLEKVGKRYGRKAVLEGATLSLPTGLTLLIGPSGAGKSTLLRMIATAERPTAGTLFWDGVPLPAATTALRRTLGYAPQSVDLPDDLTAREFAMHMAALKGLDLRAADVQFNAITQAIGLQGDLDRRIVSFSGGMRRRLILAQAMLGAPGLLALDEPTAELDAETAQAVGALILSAARDAVVVMTTHLAEGLTPAARAVVHVEHGTVLQL